MVLEDGQPTWSEQAWRSPILLAQLRVRTDLLRNLAEKLEHSGDFPTETPRKLCQLIKSSAHVIQQSLPNIPDEQLANVDTFLCGIAQHLRFVERSHTPQTPWSMVQATEEFLRTCTGKNNNFIIRPQWAYNYSLVGEFVDVYRTYFSGMDWISSAEWESSIAKIGKQRIYCLAFPRIERLNALLHASWGHEVGHIIAGQWTQEHFYPLWSQAEARIKEQIQSEVQAHPPPGPPLFQQVVIDTVVADWLNMALKATQCGFVELICDAIGTHLFGPAALAAAIEFSASLSLDESPLSSDMYPPWRYRLRRMVANCGEDIKPQKVGRRKHKYDCPDPLLDPFLAWLRESNQLVQSNSDTDCLHAHVATREAYKLIEDEWEAVKTQAIRLLPRKLLRPYRLFRRANVVRELAQRLELGMPPNEIGLSPDASPAPFEDILNAAWVFKVKKMKEGPEWGSPEDIHRLWLLVLKGIESSFVQKVFGGRLRRLDTQ